VTPWVIFEIVFFGAVLGLISLTQGPARIRIFLLTCATIYFSAIASIRNFDASIAYAQYQHTDLGFPFSTASWLYPAGLQALAGLSVAFGTRLIVQTIIKRNAISK
jgi:uncharacterized membrane protein YedE/YeeE